MGLGCCAFRSNERGGVVGRMDADVFGLKTNNIINNPIKPVAEQDFWGYLSRQYSSYDPGVARYWPV